MSQVLCFRLKRKEMERDDHTGEKLKKQKRSTSPTVSVTFDKGKRSNRGEGDTPEMLDKSADIMLSLCGIGVRVRVNNFSS